MDKDFVTAWASSSPERQRLLAEEAFLLSVAADIEQQMEAASVSKSNLAERLGTSKAHISQALTGQRNMTLRTLAGIAWALDSNISVQITPKAAHRDWVVTRPGGAGFVVASRRLGVDTSAANDYPTVNWQTNEQQAFISRAAA